MKKNNILSCLSLVDNRIILKKQNYQLTIKDLISLSGSRYIDQIRGKKVAIDQNDFDKAILIALADGVVDELYILPQGYLKNNSKFLKKYNIDEVLNCQKLQPIEPNSFPFEEILSNYNIETKWILQTSGTSGNPKQVQHNFSSISSSVKFSKTMNNQLTWGSTYSLDRFAGTQVFLQALLGGGTILFPQSKALGGVIDEFIDGKVDSISATPTLWRKILMQKNSINLNLSNITLGGEIADQNILNSLLKAFPDSRIRHIFASTESGASITVEDCLEGFPSTLIDSMENNYSLTVSKKGTLMVKASGMSQGYIDENKEFKSKNGYYDTGDLIELRGKRYHFLGRESGIINIGGTKIIPEEVEKKILTFPGVIDVLVYGRKNSIIGNLLACDLVVDKAVVKDTNLFLDSLKKYYKENNNDISCPRMYKIVDEISTSNAGKAIRR